MEKETNHTTPISGKNEPLVGEKLTYDRLIRRKEVTQITGLASSSITYLIDKGDFPPPVKLSERMSAWRLSWVLAWMEQKAPTNQEAA